MAGAPGRLKGIRDEAQALPSCAWPALEHFGGYPFEVYTLAMDEAMLGAMTPARWGWTDRSWRQSARAPLRAKDHEGREA